VEPAPLGSAVTEAADQQHVEPAEGERQGLAREHRNRSQVGLVADGRADRQPLGAAEHGNVDGGHVQGAIVCGRVLVQREHRDTADTQCVPRRVVGSVIVGRPTMRTVSAAV
jgi:hypothetical protein